MKTKICKNCNKEFEVDRVPSGKYSRRQYCSRECEIEYNRKNKKKNKCKYCGKDINKYYADGSYAKNLEYCSDECREAALKEKYGYSVCKNCGKKFKRKRTTIGAYSECLFCDNCLNDFKYINCDICGAKFLKTEDYKGKYCKSCREKENYKYTHRTCPQCGQDFEISRLVSGRLSGQVLCEKCAKENYEKAHFGVCVVCGRRFEYHRDSKNYISKTKYCSDACFNILKPQRRKSWLEKVTKTNLEKFGVPYTCLTKQCQDAQGNIISKINMTFADLLTENNIKFEQEFMLQDGLYSYDFCVQSDNFNYLIEINPTFTHTCIDTGVYAPRDENYHIDKTKTAIENGYRCINVWDWDDWDKIISLIKPKQKLYARKLELKEITKQEANKFINQYHLQNSCRGNIVNLGLYYDTELVQVMTFGRPRYNKNYEYELLRLCTKSSYKIVGGANKLFKYFIRTYEPVSVISYCDKSKFKGDVYFTLGFKLDSVSPPQKVWSDRKDKYVTDNLLRQRGFDQLVGSKLNPPEIYGKDTDNEELMIQHKWLPVYDCGQNVFVWHQY